MKKNLLIGIGIAVVLLFMGYRIYTGIEEKRKEREQEQATPEQTVLDDSAVFAVDTARVETVSLPECDILANKVNEALDEYDNLSTNNSGYSGNDGSISIVKEDDGEVLIRGFDFNVKEPMYYCNIKDVKFMYKKITPTTVNMLDYEEDENGAIGSTNIKEVVYFFCADSSSCVRTSNGRAEWGMIEVYNQKHGRAVIDALLNLRSYYTNSKKRKKKE